MKIDKDKVEQYVHWGLVIFLALIIVYAVWPFEIFKSSRNAVRKNQMEMIMSAVYSYAVDTTGFYPDCIPPFSEGPAKVSDCKEDLEKNIMGEFPADPDPEHNYMIERIDDRERFRIFSTSPEAKGVEVIQ